MNIKEVKGKKGEKKNKEIIRVSCKVTLFSPFFGSPFTPKPFFQPQISDIHKVRRFYLKWV
jgi:hypothetical protein